MRQLLRTYAKDIDCKSGPHQHYQQLIEIIKKRSKDTSCATLFAKPVKSIQDGSIDWYTELEGDVIALNQATEEETTTFWDKYDLINEKLDRVADELGHLQRKSAQDNAVRLEQMRMYPGSIEYLFLVAGEPVIAAWGCGSAPVIPPEERLIRKPVQIETDPLPEPPKLPEQNKDPDPVKIPEQKIEQPPPPLENPIAPPERKKRSWIWWLLSLLLFILICLLMFQRCSNQKIIPIETEKEQVDKMAVQADDMRKEIDNLKNRLTSEWSNCPECQNLNSDSVQNRIDEYVPDLPPSKVSVSLIWNTYHDLDLHVYPPNGDHLYFKKRSDRNGGRLNIDFNNKLKKDSFSRRPLENVTWPQDQAPSGQYTVKVMLYRQDERDAAVNPVPYLVTIEVNNKVKEIRGAVPFHKTKKYQFVHRFRVD